jgi:serine/threonine protein kinase
MSVDPAAPVETGRYCLVCCLEKGQEDTCGSCGAAVGEKPIRQPSNLPPGTLLDRRYLLGRSLGAGTFGTTYLAVDIWLRLRVAVKEYMPRDLAMRSGEDDVVPNTDGDREAFVYGLQSFLDEGRKLARFEGHPNIVGVKSFFEENGTAYLVMQYLDGCSLEEYRRARGGCLPAGEVVAIAVAILEGLQAIHDVGMLHRDIKPQNVIITTTGQVKLIDFGAARFAAGQRTSNLSQVLTPRYAPIEQYQSDEIQGPWTDVYATGATLYKVLTGELPPEAIARVLEGAPVQSPREIVGEAVSEKVSAALMRALEPSAVSRYQSALDFIDGISDPEQTPLIWPCPPSADRTDGEVSCHLDGPGVVASADLRSAAPVGSAPSRSDRSSPSPISTPRPSPSPISTPRPSPTPTPTPRPSPGASSSRRRAAAPSGPPREPTESTWARPQPRRKRRRRKSRGLWLLNGFLFLLLVGMGVLLVLLLVSRGEQGEGVAGCGGLSPTACAAEAERLDSEGRSEAALLLAYLAPVEEPSTRDRIFERAGVGPDWGSRERFACADPAMPCGSLDFWTADRDAPGGDRALSALGGRCDQGDRDACYLRILVQRRLTLIEPEPPLEAGVGGDQRGGAGGGRGDGADEGASARTAPRDRTAAGAGPARISVGARSDRVSEAGAPEEGTSDEAHRSATSGSDVTAGASGTGSGDTRAGASTEAGDPERVVGDPEESAERTVGDRSERVVGEPTETSERVVGEPAERTERVVGEPVERVVGEPVERVVGEPVERVVGESPEQTPDPASDDAGD